MSQTSIPPLKINTPKGRLLATALPAMLGDRLSQLPHVLRLLIENHVRESGESDSVLAAVDQWLSGHSVTSELQFQPNRLLMHDTTCTPALVDIAGMRDVLSECGSDPMRLSPQCQVDVVIDHSVAVDAFAQPDAIVINELNELSRNADRYSFMKWAMQSMDNITVHPPGSGIMHTINLEQLSTLVVLHSDGRVHPDMMLGTDSHTPMVNAIGVLAWGIGGLEAESIMFGQKVSLAFPSIVGVELKGCLSGGVLATDLALEITHLLRKADVTGCYVEFFGDGVPTLTVDQRAVIANMAPEYGATTGFFAVDAQTLHYFDRTSRPKVLTDTIESVYKAMGLWFEPTDRPRFDRTITLQLASIRPLVAGPYRPQDRHPVTDTQIAVEKRLSRSLDATENDGIPDGAVGIAAITSCTNTSSPQLMIAAGLLAKKAVEFGLSPPRWVKTSLAPGSTSAQHYLTRAGLLDKLARVGFDIVGFGCTTCIGNSGALPEVIDDAVNQKKAVVAVLSGNRNFPGRVHPKLELAFLASPPMVIAFALKGDIQGNIASEPIGKSKQGRSIYLRDIWPTETEIDDAMDLGYRRSDVPAAFHRAQQSESWHRISAPTTPCYAWDNHSRDLRRPKFVTLNARNKLGFFRAVPLMVLGDDITTDHISPAGAVEKNSEAGKWLLARGANPADLNVYASYRGNWEVMLRGVFTNRKLVNYLSEDLPPPFTVLPDQTKLPIHLAAEQYIADDRAVVILAGHRYGMGSSRDWAAKGVALLGTRAVLAQSFERIHRSNLIGMGVLPIQLVDGFEPARAGLTVADQIEIDLPASTLKPRMRHSICIIRANGEIQKISVVLAIDTLQEVKILQQGGIFAEILKKFNAGN